MARRRGFTLIEFLVVVLILGILAAIVVPRFTNASDRSRDSTARTQLSYLRGQIDVFMSQHHGVPPQNGCVWTILQATSSFNETNTMAPTGTAFGPYFRMNPANPWDSLTTASAASVDVHAGWYYSADATSYELRLRNTDGSINYKY